MAAASEFLYPTTSPMKRTLMFLLLMPISLFAQKLSVNVYLSGMPEKTKFYLFQDTKKIDSSRSKNNILHFRILKQSPEMLQLVLKRSDQKQSFLLLLDNQSTFFRGNFHSDRALSADHSQSQNDMRAYTELTDATSNRLMSIQDTARNRNLMDSLKTKLKGQNAVFIKTHSGSMISALAIFMELGRKHLTKGEAYSLYSLLSKTQQKSGHGRDIIKAIRLLDYPQPGSIAPNFVMNDLSGKRIDLKDYRGKNVVLIFWESSCIPCRWEAPQLVQLYDTCKNKNVEFISISLDQNTESWTKAARVDHCTWPNVSDLSGWASDAALSYGITALPEHVIIDSNGVIAKRPGPIWELKEQLLSFLDKK